jgi:hypothetical protein
MLSALEAAKQIAASRGRDVATTASGKLGDAIRHENDAFIDHEGDQQTLLMRYGAPCTCGAPGVAGGGGSLQVHMCCNIIRPKRHLAGCGGEWGSSAGRMGWGQ